MLSEINNHLWQSTACAILIGIITIGFRKNRAYIRYWMWLGASLKFLLPFAILVSLGRHLDWTLPGHTTPAASVVMPSMVQMSAPFRDALPPMNPVRDTHDWATICICGLWACGFVTIVLLRLRGWSRIRNAVRLSTPVDIRGDIQVRASRSLMEPGVVGLFRPILLLPEGIAERLNPSQMKAILAHELCHVRRRDNLTSALHMIVEAAFWFHPLVWWIGARLVEERERACDEAVLSLGNEPRDYAEGILSVCKNYRQAPLSCVSGVTGADLKRRIQAILEGCVAFDLTLVKKLALALAGLTVLTAPIIVGAIGAPRTVAQSRLVTPKFEVVSIRTCSAFRKLTVEDWSGGKLHSECTTVERLIQQSYGLFANGQMDPAKSSLTVSGGPAWTNTDLYEIDAKASAAEPHTIMNGPILRAILEEKFGLKLHLESTEAPVYAVTVAAGGPKLQPFRGKCAVRNFNNPPSPGDCDVAHLHTNGLDIDAATIADLCASFSVLLDRPIVDETGLTGRFNMHLDLSAEDGALLKRPRAITAVSDPTAPAPPPISFSGTKAALKDLGLDLEPSQGPSEFLVVDKVEKPSIN
jgi:bla regulator protein BlaR1